MPITLGTNIASLRAQSALSRANETLEKSFERLSSGQRINSASDDPAGLYLALQTKSASRLATQSVRNINDALSAINIAESALSEITAVTIRQEELAIQASNGSISAKQRKALHAEADALTREMNRIVATTKFNGVTLLTPSQSMTVQVGETGSDYLVSALGSRFSPTAGTGAYGTGNTIAAAGPSGQGMSADLNGDGYDDLIRTEYSSDRYAVHLSAGDGTFIAPTYVTSGDLPITANLADVNGDGRLDLIGADTTDATVSVYLGNGNGTFRARVSYSTGTAGAQPFEVEIGDINGDGRADLVAANYARDNVVVFLGTGDGSFGAQLTIGPGAGSGTYSVELADYNSDGATDIIFADRPGGYITVALNQGGAFSSNQISVPSPRWMEGGDFDNDGNADLIFSDSITHSVYVMLGNGDGTFSGALTITGMTGSRSVVVEDLNGDGYDDFVAGARDGNFSIAVLGNGDGTFRIAATLASPNPHGVATGDFNGDGGMDVVGLNDLAANYTVFLAQTAANGKVPAINISTREGALEAIGTLRETRDRLALELSLVGAQQSRMQTAAAVASARQVELEAAASRIMDADIALEAADLIRAQILQQSQVAILAQANAQPTLALELLSSLNR